MPALWYDFSAIFRSSVSLWLDRCITDPINPSNNHNVTCSFVDHIFVVVDRCGRFFTVLPPTIWKERLMVKRVKMFGIDGEKVVGCLIWMESYQKVWWTIFWHFMFFYWFRNTNPNPWWHNWWNSMLVRTCN